MKLWHGIAGFVALMALAAWLVYARVLNPIAFTGPVGLFVGWLIRQPVEMRRPPPLPRLQDITVELDEEDTRP